LNTLLTTLRARVQTLELAPREIKFEERQNEVRNIDKVTGVIKIPLAGFGLMCLKIFMLY
jgi:hypothetical protein